MRYSQGDQDDILLAIFEKIGVTNKVCVEFGFNSMKLDGGTGSNTARLIIEEGWSGTLFDKDLENPGINLCREFLTPENIASVFAKHGVPVRADYVSIDVNSVDLWLFRALLVAGYRPRVVSVEYNANYGINELVTVRPGTVWMNGDRCYGASLAALHRVGYEFGYVLVDVAPYEDAFFVRDDLWPWPTSLTKFERYTRFPMHAISTPERAEVMMEYR